MSAADDLGRTRVGKTAKDKKNGHQPYRKNTKAPGERGHKGGKSKFQYIKSMKRKQRKHESP